jgi:uncharacterized protein YjiS (DUF1127 family)
MFRRLLNRLAEYRRQQRALQELYSLDDRSLADLGITRSEIPYLIAKRNESGPTPRKSALRAFRHA